MPPWNDYDWDYDDSWYYDDIDDWDDSELEERYEGFSYGDLDEDVEIEDA